MLPQGLAETLIASGLLLPEQAESTLMMAQQENIPFVTLLIRQRVTDTSRLAAAIADSFGYPLLDLDAVDTGTCPCDILDRGFLQKHRVLPLSAQPLPHASTASPLIIVFADPVSLQALDDIRIHTGRQVDAAVADGSRLWQLLDHLITETSTVNVPSQASMHNALSEIDADDARATDSTSPTGAPLVHPESKIDDAPLVRFVDNILLDAVRSKASDIHIEPFEQFLRIRCRIDGCLREISRPPATLAPRVISRIKVMADMDISERRLPQDGRLRVATNADGGVADNRHPIDFRVSSMPTLWGEKIVLRLLDSGVTRKTLDDLGYAVAQQSRYHEALQKNQGLILITGPTGSGKTVSLYAGLGLLNTLERNISTVEDPVEMQMQGINQLAINKRTGLDFASALRAFMRQDPDVIMVGEIRDRETADIAIKAAQTGHLVLSTLHTNSAAGSITRLLNMGVPAYNLCGSLSLIIAQRLVRRLCATCKVKATESQARLRAAGMTADQASSARVFQPAGCHRCHQGYRGRVCVAEVLPMSEKLNTLLLHGASTSDISQVAASMGLLSLRESALARVADGDITLADADRLIL